MTAAALLLCVALGSLVRARHALVKEVGVGCAIAVLINAAIVRALLVPSLMQLVGRRNWWAPQSLRALRASGRRAALPRPQQPGPEPEHLAVSRYCDRRHPTIFAVLSRLLDGDEPDRAAALKLFRFVRDEVRYELGPWGVTASETLARGGGTCTNKANLLVALLRAAGIPAAYGVLRVDARHYFGPIAPDFLARYASTDSTHIYAAAFLESRWVRCDPSTDRSSPR